VEGVTQEGTEKVLAHSIPLEHLLPKTDKFFRYSGSLTTPDCNEGVVWTVLQTYAPISTEQV
jgi:carbonic anhydrase